MKLHEIADRIGALVLYPGKHPQAEIARVCAGDRISDLLAQAREDAIIVTRLDNVQLIRICDLMETPAVCLLNGVVPGPEFTREAEERGTAVMVSSADLDETRSRLERLL
jgi:hypothetical protein